MAGYIALLRAVNLAGSGKLLMSDLKAVCERAGFAQIRTYIASGNVVFRADLPEAQVKGALEAGLAALTGRPTEVLIRTGAEIAGVLKANPFPAAAPNRTIAIFLDERPTADALEAATGRNGEEMRIGVREIYVHYPGGMGGSKLKIPAAKHGTARNMNTVAKLARMAAEL